MTNICQVGDRHQITEPRNQGNPNKDKTPRKQWHACTYFHVAENQRQKTFKADTRKAMLSTQKQNQGFTDFPSPTVQANMKEKPAFSSKNWG